MAVAALQLVCVSFLALFIVGAASDGYEKEAVDGVVVALKDGGRLQGSILKSSKGHSFYAFRGIPYAEPPVGELRFKPPVPKAPWRDSIFDASDDGPVCAQFSIMTNGILGQEDCLRVNVYTRKLPGIDKSVDDKTPVMVFFHGGGFMLGDGSSRFYSPALLMEADIILVTFNYRLNAFGFLSTGDEASPGNYGMLDQVLVLKWVQENIEAFGGDPERVTIFGGSAGAASVSQHVLSPLSKGLFHGVIALSGASTCVWALNEDPLYWAKQLARDLKCTTDDNQKLVDCLRKIPADDIVKFANSYMKKSLFPIPFVPCVDGHFLPEHPLKLLNSPEKLNKVPVISGLTEEEGAFFMAHIVSTKSTESFTSLEYLTSVIDNLFSNPKPVKEVTKLVKKMYFGSVDISNETQVQLALVDAMSEGLFDVCHYETISLLAKAGLHTFAYNYAFEATMSFAQLFVGARNTWGVSHADDLFMLFQFPSYTFEEREEKMSQTIIKIWTNFAKHGVPIPENDQSLPKWPVVKDDTVPVYNFNDEITVHTYDLVNNRKYNFWTKDVRKARATKTSNTPKDEL